MKRLESKGVTRKDNSAEDSCGELESLHSGGGGRIDLVQSGNYWRIMVW